MKRLVETFGLIFIFLIILALITSIISISDTTIYTPISSSDDRSSLRALWSDTDISGSNENMQIGMAILSVLLFITIFSILIYSKEETT